MPSAIRAKCCTPKGRISPTTKALSISSICHEEAVKVDPRSPQAMIDEAVNAAKQSDVVVAVVGEAQGMAHEASSRTDITIPQSQRDLIAR